MSEFERLHPALQHHIVNSIGWTDLRPVQALSITAYLDGANLVILAPTAGGKTEAAFFPVLSQMLTESWEGLSVLYVSPIKALLNNQEHRLARYFQLDVTLVRVLWVVLTVFPMPFFGVVSYIVAWIVMPKDPVTALAHAPTMN